MDSTAASPSFTIYSYPSNEHGSNGNGSNDQLHFADICTRWNSGAPAMFRASSLRFKSGAARSSVPEPALSLPKGQALGAVAAAAPARSPLPIWKRAMDIAGSFLGLAMACPFLLIHMVILKVVSPGPVFFKQKRIRYLCRPFEMWKLRTMDVNADASFHRRHVSQLINGANKRDSDRPMVKLDDNPHIIPGGIILRKTCLDEMPQLINVLRGEMSLVGPRPPLAYEVEEFLKWQQQTLRRRAGYDGFVAGQRKEQADVLKDDQAGHSVLETKIILVGLDNPFENTVSDCFSNQG